MLPVVFKNLLEVVHSLRVFDSEVIFKQGAVIPSAVGEILAADANELVIDQQCLTVQIAIVVWIRELPYTPARVRSAMSSCSSMLVRWPRTPLSHSLLDVLLPGCRRLIPRTVIWFPARIQ